jgi:hypothetical protein
MIGLMLQEWAFVTVVFIIVVGLVFCVRLVMQPWIKQSGRESVCEHEFSEYRHEVDGRSVFVCFFCGKCGARRMGGMDIQAGVITKAEEQQT